MVSDLSLKIASLESSVGSNPTAPSSTSSTNEALTSLVTLLAQKERRETQEKDRRDRDRDNDVKSKYWRDMHNLVKAAPEFDGSGDVLFWLEEIRQYTKRHRVSNSVMETNIIVGALTGPAREWFGSLDFIDK